MHKLFCVCRPHTFLKFSFARSLQRRGLHNPGVIDPKNYSSTLRKSKNCKKFFPEKFKFDEYNIANTFKENGKKNLKRLDKLWAILRV